MIEKTSPSRNKSKIKIKNAKKLFKDVNAGANEMLIAYEKRKDNPNRFRRVFKEKIYDKISSNVLLGQKYEGKTKAKRKLQKIGKLIVYTLLSITIIAITNMLLLEKFSSAVNEYVEKTSDIKDKKVLVVIKEIFQLFVNKMKELTVLQRLLVGTLLINTFVNQIPVAIKRANQASDAPFFEMLRDVFKNLVTLENKRIIQTEAD